MAQRIALAVTRTRNLYHLFGSYFTDLVVSFSEASAPLRLDRPVT